MAWSRLSRSSNPAKPSRVVVLPLDDADIGGDVRRGNPPPLQLLNDEDQLSLCRQAGGSLHARRTLVDAQLQIERNTSFHGLDMRGEFLDDIQGSAVFRKKTFRILGCHGVIHDVGHVQREKRVVTSRLNDVPGTFQTAGASPDRNMVRIRAVYGMRVRLQSLR